MTQPEGSSCTHVPFNTCNLTDVAAQKSESPVRSGLHRQNTFPLNPGHAAGNDSAESLDNLSDKSARYGPRAGHVHAGSCVSQGVPILLQDTRLQGSSRVDSN